MLRRDFSGRRVGMEILDHDLRSAVIRVVNVQLFLDQLIWRHYLLKIIHVGIV